MPLLNDVPPGIPGTKDLVGRIAGEVYPLPDIQRTARETRTRRIDTRTRVRDGPVADDISDRLRQVDHGVVSVRNVIASASITSRESKSQGAGGWERCV